ncbi:MAG: ABC transporter ATP-binding protein [Actinomycetota bacterium]|nr:ABC transporter ATP-binding protein [Actinomycetota bacterium]
MSGILGQVERAVPAPTARPAVAVSNVSKSFRLPHEQYHTLKERALHPFRKRSFDSLEAVRDVSFALAAGEFFGIVGRNGSGKSTLLKCLAGIYEIDQGNLRIEGRLSPFIELGVGFNPELTARDNVIINAIMLGLTRKQARERFADVLAFAELEEFVDLKLKNYSSGMYVRLAFATAVQVDADVLLIDEVLAVGDASFQQKCFDEFTRLRDAGRTILFVTHDMAAVERFCDRALLLERGRVVEIGEPSAIARKYNQMNFSRVRAEREPSRSSDTRAGSEAAEVMNAGFESPDGEPLLTTDQGDPCTVRMDVRFVADVEDPIFAITLQNESGNVAFATNTDVQRIETGRFPAGTTAVIRMRFDNRLAPGRYRLFATVARAGLGADVLDAHISNSILVLADKAGGGIADLAHDFDISRDGGKH